MQTKVHRESPNRVTEEQMFVALTSGYRWVEAIGPKGEKVRTLMEDSGLVKRLDPAHPDAPIFQITPLPF